MSTSSLRDFKVLQFKIIIKHYVLMLTNYDGACIVAELLHFLYYKTFKSIHYLWLSPKLGNGSYSDSALDL